MCGSLLAGRHVYPKGANPVVPAVEKTLVLSEARIHESGSLGEVALSRVR